MTCVRQEEHRSAPDWHPCPTERIVYRWESEHIHGTLRHCVQWLQPYSLHAWPLHHFESTWRLHKITTYMILALMKGLQVCPLRMKSQYWFTLPRKLFLPWTAAVSSGRTSVLDLLTLSADLDTGTIRNLTDSYQWEALPDISGDFVVWRDGYAGIVHPRRRLRSPPHIHGHGWTF